ncbi:hypothetical protein B0J11DRAFT_263729 [Dendryphion nanum]|uniref:Uncharacterized protein n=1 Tax=Dendryphion nanum TaxID=256645 RepID=A0A9P9DZK8_9PLEO|nr:hypothetical protein B0J11DRAFT_263729 [Dendryphion nanum]
MWESFALPIFMSSGLAYGSVVVESSAVGRVLAHIRPEISLYEAYLLLVTRKHQNSQEQPAHKPDLGVTCSAMYIIADTKPEATMIGWVYFTQQSTWFLNFLFKVLGWGDVSCSEQMSRKELLKGM